MHFVVLGAGAHGLSLAYHLLKEGEKVTVVEKGEVSHGSSGRNAGRYRYHFFSRENVEFAKEAIPYLLSMCKKLPLNPVCMKTGYLWTETEGVRKLDPMWRAEGVGGKFVECSEFPFMKGGEGEECYYAPQDGSFHHDYISLGLYLEIKRMGGEFVRGEAKELVKRQGKVVGVKVEDHVVGGDAVAVTLGAWTGEFMRRNGIDVPITPEKRELFLTEGVKFRVKPLVIGRGFYFSQTLKGELIGGIDSPESSLTLDTSLVNSLSFISHVRKVVKGLEGVRLLRSWSGYYEITPDRSHVMGFDPSWPENLFVDAGYSGHGMMFSLYAGKVISDFMLGRRNKFVEIFSPSRFQRHVTVDERMVI
ncbi:D-amino acid dehydrogenase [Sulfuracidifex tepidarius]|uniref:D-amino acid dehydrogenase n=1 Tax=Sulfuracidifex tepidarius TaxID=1294262 RepID=A0A510DY40_9CREN|nr:FAD-binding oxidoreductase [Sulfuracidifex tepidarius]BBG25109.1 D-amino acid dehydrogenase [Sulfuracidifex tepidarius]